VVKYRKYSSGVMFKTLGNILVFVIRSGKQREKTEMVVQGLTPNSMEESTVSNLAPKYFASAFTRYS